ncbi:hypothetical protein ACFLUV_00905 [Elusimicrobiota bacterium]
MKRPNKAVIVGLYPCGLGLLRSLAKKGIEIIAICDNDIPDRYSRYCKIVRCSDSTDEEALKKVLLEIGKNEEFQPALFMTGDDNVRIVSENREMLSEYYLLSLPDKNTVMTLLEKSLFAQYSKTRDLKIPGTIIVNNTDSLDKIIDKVTFPCILKPALRTMEWNKNSGDNKAYRINSRDELLTVVKSVNAYYKGEYIIQEWIAGDDSNVYFCLMYYNRSGELKLSFTGRKLIQWLPETGSTCIAEGIDCSYVREESRKLFDGLGYRGIGSIEYKLDKNTGEFKITEPTVARVNLQSSIALLKGINIPFAYYCELTGNEYAGKSKKRKVLWIQEESLMRYIFNHGFKKLLNSGMIKKVLINKKGFLFFNIRDLGPFIFLIYNDIKVMLSKLRKCHR